VSPEFVINNPDKPWDWDWLSRNTMENSDLNKLKRKKEIVSLMCCRNKLKMCDDVLRYTTDFVV
jgi:hypothetical protein